MQKRQMRREIHGRRQFGEIRSREIGEYTDTLTGVWDVESCQLGPSKMESNTRFVTDGGALLYREQVGMEVLLRGALNGDHLVFGIPDERSRSGRWQGQAYPEGALICIKAGVALDLVFPAASIVTVAVLPAGTAAARIAALSGRCAAGLLDRKDIFLEVGTRGLRALSRRWHKTLLPSGSRPGRPLVDELVDALVSTRVEQAEFVQPPLRAARRTFRRAMAHCEEHGFECRPEQLAWETGVCVRTLRDAFRRCTGKSPSRFLRCLRLRQVRERLLDLGPGETTVTDEAVAMGFTELGRFSGEYRRVFGELPSATLRRGRLRKGIVMKGPR